MCSRRFRPPTNSIRRLQFEKHDLPQILLFFVLQNATENFSASNLIGLGGSSYVYRGRLKDGSNVAVKLLKDQGGLDADSAFFEEIELLSRLHHCNLVPLLGYCSEIKGKHVQRLLVFEYISNGNLRDCLDGVAGNNLDWATRVTIAIGAARGLEYLHEAAAPRILNRDVKSSNILLDENWHAKAVPRLQDSRRVITELIDPKLNGNFREEEVQIMAYLARECLLLDPDTRPTMSEVVQIISSISPGKSTRRRNISSSLFQEQDDAEKQRQVLSHCSLTLDIDHKNKEADEHEEIFMLLTSKTKGWQTSEEEMVDLTEPRLNHSAWHLHEKKTRRHKFQEHL